MCNTVSCLESRGIHNVYTEKVTSVCGHRKIDHHLFADGKQSYASTPLEGVDNVTRSTTWLYHRHQHTGAPPVGSNSTYYQDRAQLAVVRDLGVLLDQELSMTQHIAKVTSSCFYQLRRLRQIRRPVGQELVAQLVHSFVLSRLDYGNSVLAGLPKSVILPLQRVQNAAARLTSRFTDERSRDTSSEAAPLVTRRPSSGLQTVHHDALNSHWTVSDVFCRHGACRRLQPHEVRSAIRWHQSVHKAALSHWDRQACVFVRRPSRLERSSTVDSTASQTLKLFRKQLKTYYFNRTFVDFL